MKSSPRELISGSSLGVFCSTPTTWDLGVPNTGGNDLPSLGHIWVEQITLKLPMIVQRPFPGKEQPFWSNMRFESITTVKRREVLKYWQGDLGRLQNNWLGWKIGITEMKYGKGPEEILRLPLNGITSSLLCALHFLKMKTSRKRRCLTLLSQSFSLDV